MAPKIFRWWASFLKRDEELILVSLLFFGVGVLAVVLLVQPVEPPFGRETSVEYLLPPGLPLKQLVLSGDGDNRLKARSITEFVNGVEGAYGVVHLDDDGEVSLRLYGDNSPLYFSLRLGKAPSLPTAVAAWNKAAIDAGRVVATKEKITVPFVYSRSEALKWVAALFAGFIGWAILSSAFILPPLAYLHRKKKD